MEIRGMHVALASSSGPEEFGGFSGMAQMAGILQREQDVSIDKQGAVTQVTPGVQRDTPAVERIRDCGHEPFE